MPPEELYRARWAKKVSGCPTFHLPDVVGDCEFGGAWAMGIIVALNMHVDPGDFLWSHTSIQCRGPATERVLAYFCFPTLALAIPLRAGDHLLFNPAVPHMVSSRTEVGDKIYCLSLYFKTNLLGGNNNS